jgi:ABC-2 type transport system ATP-binding protein
VFLELREISKFFGAQKALEDVSFGVEQGECFGLLGPNGAGKTTLVNILSGFLLPDSGEISFLGKSYSFIPLEIRGEIGIVPQEIALYENLTVYDNLRYFGELYGLRGKFLNERIQKLLKEVELLERKKQKVKTLSGGMKRRVNLIAGLIHSPKLLLVDEPTVGVDPQARLFIYSLIKKLANEGMAVLYTTHYLREAEELCRRMAILDKGKVVALGSREEILKACGIGEKGNLEEAFFYLTGSALRESDGF